MTRFPVISLVTTVVCLGALIVGIFSTTKAVSSTIDALVNVFQFLSEEYEYVEDYRNSYWLVAGWTMCFAVSALVYDFVLTNSKKPYRHTLVSLTVSFQ